MSTELSERTGTAYIAKGCTHGKGVACWLCSNQVSWWAEAREKALRTGRITAVDLEPREVAPVTLAIMPHLPRRLRAPGGKRARVHGFRRLIALSLIRLHPGISAVGVEMRGGMPNVSAWRILRELVDEGLITRRREQAVWSYYVIQEEMVPAMQRSQ